MSQRSLGVDEFEREVRAQFPALDERVGDNPLVYLDSAATSLTPQPVIDAIVDCYRRGYGNVDRGAHTLGERSSRAYRAARATVAQFFNASRPEEVVFVRSCTEALNLVARSWGDQWVGEGDEVLVCELSHHSHWLPWQQLCERRGATLRVVPMLSDGSLDMPAYRRLVGARTKVVALTHVSNVLGTVCDVAALAALAHEHGACVVVDGAQAAAHLQVDVQALGCDFYACSAHKLYGPFGIGVLFATQSALEKMPVWMTGGGMAHAVSVDSAVYAPAPQKFEPGTPNVAGAVGLAAALRFIDSLGWTDIASHERRIVRYATEQLSRLPGVQCLGASEGRCGVLSFLVQGVHSHDLSTVLDSFGVAVRAGHHCAQPTMDRLGVDSTCRASFGVYSTQREVDALCSGVVAARELFVDG